MRRDIARVLSLTAIAQVAAFGKSILIAYYFGIGVQLDGYYLGQAIPVTITGILMGFLQTGFLTVYAGQLAKAETHAAAALLGRMLAVLTLVGVITGIVLSAAAPWIVSLLAPDSASSVQDAAVASLRVLAFLLLLNSLVDCLSLALSAHGSFAVAAFAPTANALVASALLAALPDWGLHNLIWGTLLGFFVQLTLVAAEVRRRGITVIWNVRVKLASVATAGASIVPGLVFANLSVLVPQIIAARMGDGAVATFSFAARLHGAATQVLAMALSAVLLPYFAHAVGRGDHAAIVAALRKGFPIIALIVVAALLWVGLVGDHFVSLIFEHGAFDKTATTAVSVTWFWLTVGLLPAIWGVVLAKVLQALRLGGTMSLIAFFGLLLTSVLSRAGCNSRHIRGGSWQRTSGTKSFAERIEYVRSLVSEPNRTDDSRDRDSCRSVLLCGFTPKPDVGGHPSRWRDA
jgi:putative peptidoglycan lipid II flippase